MKQAIRLLKEFKEKSADWKGLMIRFMDGKLEETEDSYIDILSVFSEIRESYKISDRIPDDIGEELDDPELVSLLSDYIKKSLELYYDFALLRDLQKDNADLAEQLVSVILEEFIIHNGVNGDQKIKSLLESIIEYDESKTDKLIKALGFYTNYAITNNLDKECMIINIIENGALSEELSKQISGLIWKNRIELKMDFIIHQIGNIRSASKSQ